LLFLHLLNIFLVLRCLWLLVEIWESASLFERVSRHPGVKTGPDLLRMKHKQYSEAIENKAQSGVSKVIGRGRKSA